MKQVYFPLFLEMIKLRLREISNMIMVSMAGKLWCRDTNIGCQTLEPSHLIILLCLPKLCFLINQVIKDQKEMPISSLYFLELKSTRANICRKITDNRQHETQLKRIKGHKNEFRTYFL